MLSSHLYVSLPTGLSLSGFPIKILCAFLIPYACCVGHRSHSYWFDHRNNARWSVQIMLIFIKQSFLFSCCFFSHRSVCIYIPQHLLSNIFNICSFLSVRDQVLYIFIIACLVRSLEDKRFWTERCQAFLLFNKVSLHCTTEITRGIALWSVPPSQTSYRIRLFFLTQY
jgi:hypothetical protein